MNLADLKNAASQISDEGIRNFTLNIIEFSPEGSWRLPSSRDHHMRDECGEWGNLIHTLRVVKICDCLADILNLPPIKKDVLKAAAILHDSCKHGVKADVRWIVREHPQLVKQLISQSGAACQYGDTIEAVIHAHMGRWGNPPVNWDNQINLRFLLHAADCIESRLDSVIDTL